MPTGAAAATAHGLALLGLFFAVKAWSMGRTAFAALRRQRSRGWSGATPTSMSSCPFWALVGLPPSPPCLMGQLAGANVQLPWPRRCWSLEAPRPACWRFQQCSNVSTPSRTSCLLEAPYIERNIALTQEAYNLRQITVKPFPAEQEPTFQSLQANRATIDNIRLWDGSR